MQMYAISRPARPLAIRLLGLLATLTLTTVMAPQPVHAAVTVQSSPAPVISPPATPIPVERTTQDKLITFAAIGSIVLVAVAGTYIYVLIRKGL